MNLIRQLPLPVCGLILALLSLGNLLQDIHPYLRYLFGSIGVVFIILILLKLILYPEDIKNNFKNPVILSSCGTFSMALMLLSTYAIPFTSIGAYAIEIIGLSLHIILIIFFTYRFIIGNFDITTVYPSYWIVYIGITMGAITAPVHGFQTLGFACFAIGFLFMMVTVPLVIYRYIKYPEVPNGNKPLICIFTAIFSILIVGYTSSAPTVNAGFVMILYLLACICYVFALYKFIDYRNLEFYPSFSAFTFPFAISALATKAVSNTINNGMVNGILTIETAIATLIVVYVLLRYLNFLKNSEVDN